MEEVRYCKNCSDRLRGRVDKKFCDYLCRSSYYNRIHADSNNMIRRINRVLKQNRKILQEVKQYPIRYEDLVKRGFRFGHCTNVVQEEDKTCYFCYDIGYVPLENNYFAVVSSEEPEQWKN